MRLEYVCQERAIDVMNQETDILNQLCKEWGVEQDKITDTASRFFNGYKKL